MEEQRKSLEQSVAISSRVRLARNYRDIPFPMMMTDAMAIQSIQRTQSALSSGDACQGFQLHLLSDLSEIERIRLVERHKISPALLAKAERSAVILSPKEEVSIMVNEEDHLRIQAILPGLALEACASMANVVDDQIEKTAEYAFDSELGYLTSCPTNTGTGLRGSVMLHLPALTMVGQISPIVQAVGKIGLTVRGMYGEGSETVGSMYQLSNQVTLGRAEDDILGSLATTANQVIDHEAEARSRLYEHNRVELEDRLMRSWGLLTNARRMDAREFMKLLSDVRLAVDLALLEEEIRPLLDQLMLDVQPASLAWCSQKELSVQERDTLRAQTIRTTLIEREKE